MNTYVIQYEDSFVPRDIIKADYVQISPTGIAMFYSGNVSWAHSTIVGDMIEARSGYKAITRVEKSP